MSAEHDHQGPELTGDVALGPEGGQAMIRPDDIDGSFVPQPELDITSVELDGEVVLVRPEGQTYSLNPTGAIVWDCFDGSVAIDDIVDELTEVFGVSRDQVAGDVVALARQLGRAGLLAGVRSFSEVPGMPDVKVLERGTPLAFRLPDLDGTPVESVAIEGPQLLLVNWSPTCGFCSSIAPELARLAPELQRHDVTLVLVAAGGVEANRELIEASGLDAAVVVIQDDAPLEAFDRQGTPVAYVLDDEGRVASDLAVGADRVLAVARELAAVAAPTEPAPDDGQGRPSTGSGPRFLAEPPSS